MKYLFEFITILVSLSFVKSQNATVCSENEFSCIDGQRCLTKGQVCDDFPNCLDHSDESDELCETWEYEYEDESESQGGWFSWGGGSDYDYEENVDETVKDEIEEQEVIKENCSIKKCHHSGPLSFETNKQYKYKYEMLSQTKSTAPDSNHTSSIMTTADIQLDVMTACEMKLKVINIESKYSTAETKGYPENLHVENEFLKKIEEYPLRFSMIGGEIDVLCPTPEEDSRVLNFKRGILSMIQNTMPKFDLNHRKVEKDVIGECEMSYDFKMDFSPSVTIVKTKIIPSCKNRYHIISAVQSVPYFLPEETNELPVIETSSRCEQKILKGIILSSNCHERHVVIPLSSSKGEISTTITQNLIHESTGFSVVNLGPVYRRTDILFKYHDHINPEGESVFDKNVESDLDVVTELLNLISSDNQSEKSSSASIFSHLVAAMKPLTYAELSEILNTRNWILKDRQAFLNALPMVGTAASVKFMASGEVNILENYWKSLSFIQDPDLDVLSTISEIFSSKPIPSDAFLPIGSLLNNYCHHEPSCSSHHPVVQILEKMLSALPSNCKPSQLPEKVTLLLALRGLSNAGLALNENIFEFLDVCIANDQTDMEVRATAIETFRRVPCNQTRPSFEKILLDSSKDSELRIRSYLGLMMCPNYEIIRIVDNVLRDEEVNQVGSFIWTHLINLQETSSPTKIEIQSLISNRDYQEKFKLDFRKFSKNIEWSGFFDELNIGAFLESNIIFSQKSYVPRSMSVNFTTDLFGRSFNLFEVQSRFEGFEKEIAKLLGDYSSSDNDPNDKVSNKVIRDALSKSTRPEEYLEKAAQVSLDLKLFGEDVSFHHISGIQNIMNTISLLNPMNFLESVKSGKEFELQKSIVPFDSSFQLATSAGLPLTINMEGSAIVDASTRLQGDLFSILESHRGKVEGYLKPSVSINLKASMVVDGHAAQSGIELDSSFYSSTVADFSIEIDGSKAINFDMNLPEEKMDIFKASSKLVMIHRSNQNPSNEIIKQSNREVVGTDRAPREELYACSPNFLLLKSQLCREFKYPVIPETESNLRILSYGPLEYSLIFQKTDPSMQGYKFRYHWGLKDNSLVMTLLFETPGATLTSARLGADLIINYDTKTVSLDLNLPKRSLSIDGQYSWGPNEKKLDASINWNGKSGTSISVGYKMYEKSGKRSLIPIFLLTNLEKELFKMSGNMEERERGNNIYYGVELSFEADLYLLGGVSTGTIKGVIDHKENEWDANLSVSYSLLSLDRSESIHIKYNRIKTPDSEESVKMERTWRMIFTQFPNLSSKGKLSSKSYSGSTENIIKVSFGENFDNPDNEVSVYQNFIFYGGHKQTTFNSTLALKYPKNKLDVIMGVDFFQDVRDINTGFIFQYAEGLAVQSKFHLVKNLSGPYEIEGNWLLSVPGWINTSAKGKIKEVGPHSYDFDFEATWSADGRIEFAGHYKNLSTRLKILHSLELEIKLPSRNFIHTFSSFLYDNNQLVIECQVKLKSGAKYKVRFAYISQVDDLSAHQRKIEVDIFLPSQTYYWHSEITFGEFITISNDIHVDRFRDLNLWLQIQIMKGGDHRVHVKFWWDANRDPQKKVQVAVVWNSHSINMNSSITLLGNEYEAKWQSFRQYSYDVTNGSNWHHKHHGTITWKDNNRRLYEIELGASFDLQRGDGSQLVGNAFFSTPFEGWKHNFVNLKYARDESHIEATLKSEWHENEFFKMNFQLMKEFDGKNLKGETKFEILSSMEQNLASLSAGAGIEKRDGFVDANAYIQWDEDKVEWRVEAKNNSNSKNINVSLETKVISTLKNYSKLGAAVDLTAVEGSFSVFGSAVWEDLIYELECKGDLMSVQEYLKGELVLRTPNGGAEDAMAKIRIFHDQETRDENFQLIGRWQGKEIKLNGRVAIETQDFKAELLLETPFDKLSEASIVLGHSIKETYKTEALVKWNRTKTVGLELESRMNSLTDFLLSVNLMTPVAKYKEIRGEIKNVFILSPEVRVHSRVFGQINDLKYGIGGKYRQGKDPRLAVGLELYSNISDLQEVGFDIADRSVYPLMRYSIDFKYGKDRALSVATEFLQKQDSLLMKVTSSANLESVFGKELSSVKIESDVKINWTHGMDLYVQMAAATLTDTCKIFAIANFNEDRSGKFETNVALPFEYLRDLEMKIEFKKMSHWSYGFIKTNVIVGHQTILDGHIYGTLRDLSMAFDLPFYTYKQGSFAYKLVSQDIIRSKFVSHGILGDHSFQMDGSIFFNDDNYITQMELDVRTAHEGFNQTRIVIHGIENDESFTNFIEVSRKDKIEFEGEVNWQFRTEDDWRIKAKIFKMKNHQKSRYETLINYQNVASEPFRFVFVVKEQDVDDSIVSLNLEVKNTYWPYEAEIEWHLPIDSLPDGKSTITIQSFSNDRVASSIEVQLNTLKEKNKAFTLITDFNNRSTRDVVDLGVFMNFISKIDDSFEKRMLLNGTLRQITADDVGVLQVHVEWPNVSPITFTAEANYVSSPAFDVRTNIILDLSQAQYGFAGQILKSGTKVSIDAAPWWKSEGDLNQKKIQFSTNLSFTGDGGISGKSVLRIPMVEGLEVSTADFECKKRQDKKELRLTIVAVGVTNEINAVFKTTELPAIEANVTVSSSAFWSGTPIYIHVNQSLTAKGYYGNYNFQYPLWDLKQRKYEHESVNASLQHNSLVDGQEGVFSITSDMTKNKPVRLNYSFRFPPRPFAAVKLGIAYEAIKFELRGERSVISDTKFIIKKTSIELDNLLWPFGITFTNTENIENPSSKDVIDTLQIYDLDDESRKSTINIIRKLTSTGGRWTIKGKIFTREIEISSGYTWVSKKIGADLFVSWAPDQNLAVDLDWKERSENNLVKDQTLIAKIAHPLRIVLFDARLLQDISTTMINLDFNTDQTNPKSIPLKADITIQKANSKSYEKHYNTTVLISHPTLPTDMNLQLNLGSDQTHPCFVEFSFIYSDDPAKNVLLEATIEKDHKNRKIKNYFVAKHQNSDLLAQVSGHISYGREIYSFVQDFVYSNQNGSQTQSRIQGGFNLKEKTFQTQVEASERIVDFNMRIEEKEPGYWEVFTTSETHAKVPFTSSLRLHPSQPIFILTIDNISLRNTSALITEDPDYLRYNAEKIIIEGGYEDQRFIHFLVKHFEPLSNETRIANPCIVDSDFSLKLNHSRLLSSHLNWRKDVEQEIKNELNELVGMSHEMRNTVKEWIKQVGKLVAKEIIVRAKPIVADIIQSASPILRFYKNESVEFKNDLVMVFKQIKLTDKEKKLFSSIQYTIQNLGKSLEKLSFVQSLKRTLAKGTLRNYVIILMTRINQFYSYLTTKDPSSSSIIQKIKGLLMSFATAYDQAAKKWYLRFRNALGDFKMRLKNWLRRKWHNVYNKYKPHILKTLHFIESASFNVINKIWNWMNKFGSDIKSLSYIQTVQQVYYRINSIYQEMSNRTLKQNLQLIYTYAASYVDRATTMFVKRVLPFTEDWKEQVNKAWQKLYSYESAKVIIDFTKQIFARVRWLLSKLDSREMVINVAAFTIEHGYTIVSQTAIQAQMRHITPKTDMIWSPEKGNIRFTQKLPFEWDTFNEAPQYNEVLEIPVISPLRRWVFPSTKFSVLDTWYRFFNLNFYPSTWIPPFDATAYIIGENHLITFDGKFIDFKGSCEHILAADLIQQNWAITIRYHEYTSKTINIFLGEDIVEFSKNFKVKINGELVVLPHALNGIMLWRTAGAINLKMSPGIRVSWNSIHDVVSVTVPKTSFLNTAGLLGTNNNEPSDDLVSPNGEQIRDLKSFFESWKVSTYKCSTKEREEPATLVEPLPIPDICHELFVSRTSPFKFCFYQVDPKPYYEICRQDYKEFDIETSAVALAYRDRCTEHAIPVKLPTNYVRCEYENPATHKVKYIQEGQTITMKKDNIENAVDVVLLVERNSCNKGRLQSKQFQRFITEFDAGVKDGGVPSTRYAVVAYGGMEPFSEPSLVSTDTDVFTTSKNVANFIQNLNYPDHHVISRDKTFEAITFASNLGFRSPVNVVFLLFPCSPCEESYGLDYSTMYHILLNNAATLHVFKESYFDIDKTSFQKKILGYDLNSAFTAKDYKKKNMGDTSLKKQIRPPKEELKWCLPLAIETGGAVYTSKALNAGKKKPIERLGKIVGRRAGKMAKQSFDQHCLCLSTQEVTPILRCDKWEYGDFSVLERYGLEVAEASDFFVENDTWDDEI